MWRKMSSTALCSSGSFSNHGDDTVLVRGTPEDFDRARRPVAQPQPEIQSEAVASVHFGQKVLRSARIYRPAFEETHRLRAVAPATATGSQREEVDCEPGCVRKARTVLQQSYRPRIVSLRDQKQPRVRRFGVREPPFESLAGRRFSKAVRCGDGLRVPRLYPAEVISRGG